LEKKKRAYVTRRYAVAIQAEVKVKAKVE